jgi:hypothetical protein
VRAIARTCPAIYTRLNALGSSYRCLHKRECGLKGFSPRDTWKSGRDGMP